MRSFELTSSTSLDSRTRLQIAQYCSKEEEDSSRTTAEQQTPPRVSEFVTLPKSTFETQLQRKTELEL